MKVFVIKVLAGCVIYVVVNGFCKYYAFNEFAFGWIAALLYIATARIIEILLFKEKLYD